MNSISNHISNIGSTNNALISNVQNDSPEDWNKLVQKYTPLVFSWCQNSGFKQEDASDITQNVFVSVFKSIQNFKKVDQSCSFRSWLWKITRYRICDYLKANSNIPQGTGGTDMNQFLKQYPANEFSNDSSSQNHPLAKLLLLAMARVSTQVNEQTWHAFELLSFEAMSHQEVAEKLGMTQPAVRMLKSRILKRLKEEIQMIQMEMNFPKA